MAEERKKSMDKFLKILEQQRPVDWEHLPDLDLYMDQLLVYVNRQLEESMRDQELTSSMVNNYIKQGVVPRPVGKHYTRDHLVRLIMLCVLKEVFSIQQSKEFFDLLSLKEEAQKEYASFLEETDQAFLLCRRLIEEKKELPRTRLAAFFTLLSYSSKRTALALLESMPEES